MKNSIFQRTAVTALCAFVIFQFANGIAENSRIVTKWVHRDDETETLLFYNDGTFGVLYTERGETFLVAKGTYSGNTKKNTSPANDVVLTVTHIAEDDYWTLNKLNYPKGEVTILEKHLIWKDSSNELNFKKM
jgi:hypothetical protein